MSSNNNLNDSDSDEDDLSESRRKQLYSNLSKLKLFYALRGAGFVVAVFVPFLEKYNLDLSEILLLQAIFGAAMAILEVPSGYFSDVYGRKISLVIGTICLTLGFSMYSVSSEFWGFLVGELILAVAISFISGADTSMTFDTLAELGKAEQFRKVFGNQSFVMSLTGGISGCLGSWVIEYMWRLPVYLETLCYALTIPVAMSLIEPHRKKLANKNGVIRGIRDIVSETARLRPLVRQTILLSALVSVSTLSAFWLSQSWQVEAGLPIAAFGAAFAILRLTVAGANLISYRVIELIGYYRLVGLSIGLLLLAFSVTAMFPVLWALPVLLCFSIVRGFGMVVFSEKLNHLIPSDRRSTLLSLESLISRLMFVPLAPLLGFLADDFGLSWALYLCAGIFPIGIAILAWLSWKRELCPAPKNIVAGQPVEI